MDSGIENGVIRVIAEVAESKSGTPAYKITLETHLIKDVGLDSLDIMDVIMKLESRFNIEISDSAASNMKTVGDIVIYVRSALGNEDSREDS